MIFILDDDGATDRAIPNIDGPGPTYLTDECVALVVQPYIDGAVELRMKIGISPLPTRLKRVFDGPLSTPSGWVHITEPDLGRVMAVNPKSPRSRVVVDVDNLASDATYVEVQVEYVPWEGKGIDPPK